MGVPPNQIHVQRIFHEINNLFWGTPISGNLHIGGDGIVDDLHPYLEPSGHNFFLLAVAHGRSYRCSFRHGHMPSDPRARRRLCLGYPTGVCWCGGCGNRQQLRNQLNKYNKI